VNERLARSLVARIRSVGEAPAVTKLTAFAKRIFGDQNAVKNLNQPQPSSSGSATPQPQAPVSSEQTNSEGAASRTAGPGATGAKAVGTHAAGGTAAAPSGSRASNQSSTRVAMTRPGQSPEQGGTARLPPDIACSDRLAGYGKRRQAVCYDTFDG